jgi:membrane protease YdiL (CAAX protease family)
MLRRYAEKRPITFGIVGAIIVFVLFALINLTLIALFKSSVTSSLGYLIDGMLRIVFFVPAVVLLGYIIKDNGLKFAFSTKGFGKAMIASIPIFLCLIPLACDFFNIAEVLKDLLHAFPARIFQQISVGLFEETLFRGLLITAILIKWGDRVKGRIIAMLISASLFGLIHFLNVFSGSGGDLTHVLKTFTMGIMLAAVYIYSKNLLSAMIMHAIYDILLFGTNLIVSQNNVFLWVYSIAYEAVLLLVGPVLAILLIRKAKPFGNLTYEALDTLEESQ